MQLKSSWIFFDCLILFQPNISSRNDRNSCMWLFQEVGIDTSLLFNGLGVGDLKHFIEKIEGDERFLQLAEKEFQTSSQHVHVLFRLQTAPIVLIHLSIDPNQTVINIHHFHPICYRSLHQIFIRSSLRFVQILVGFFSNWDHFDCSDWNDRPMNLLTPLIEILFQSFNILYKVWFFRWTPRFFLQNFWSYSTLNWGFPPS